MRFKVFQQVAQWVGFLAIAVLAFYGLLTFGSGRLWAAGEASRPAAQDAPAITIPSSFNYQGLLRDPQGNLMNGPHKVRVSLWTEVQSGAELFFEEFPTVSVRDGLFNVVLGSTKPMPPAIFQNTMPLFVGVSVDDGAELLPRQRIHPVPWALLAERATTLVNNASVTNLQLNGATKIGNSWLQSGNGGGIDLQGENLVYSKDGNIRFLVDNSGTYIHHDLEVQRNLKVGVAADVKGALYLDGASPVLIKRWSNIAYPANGVLATGISANNYECTMGGWAANFDVNEINAGLWSRRVYPENGQWYILFMTRTDGTPSALFLEVVCFRKGMFEVQYGTARNSDGSDVYPLVVPTDDK